MLRRTREEGLHKAPLRKGFSLTVAWLVVAAIGLSGCTVGDLSDGGEDDGGGGGSAPDSTSITLLTYNSDAEVASADALIEAFEAENPGITVQHDVVPAGTEGVNLITTRLSTGTMAEVFVFDTGALLQALRPEETLTPLNDEAWVADLDPLFASAVTVGDNLYGGSYGTSFGGGILYNIPLYERLGLSIPMTWDEFMANNAIIKADGQADPVVQTFAETWTSQLFVLADYYNVAAALPDFADEYTAGDAKFATTPEALRGFEYLQELYEAGYYNEDNASAVLNDGLLALATGTAAHYAQIGGVAANIENVAPGKSDDVGFFALPGPDATPNGMTVWPGTSGMYIPSSVEGAELNAAKKLISFAQTQAGCDSIASGAPPTGPFLTKACELPDDVSRVAQDTNAYFESGNASPALEFLSPVKGPALEQICVQVGTGQIDAQTGAELYDEDVKKQAQQLGLPGWDD